MKVIKKYVVYEKSKLLGSDNIVLKKVEFGGCTYNSFDSEEEVIQKLIDEKKTYIDYVILREIYITIEY